MARIRAVKPEFWSSPGIETLDPWARLLYVAMWNWADDLGRGIANPRELMGFAFPLDESVTVGEVRRMLGGIRRVFGVDFYKVAGRAYYSIPSWRNHQKFDKRETGKYPGPDDPDAHEIRANAGIWDESADSADNPPDSRRVVGVGTGEQWNRGTGEQAVVPLRDYVAERAQNVTQRTAVNTGSMIVSQFADTLNVKLPSKTRQDLTAHATVSVQDGIQEQYIRRGLELWFAKNMGAGALPGFILEAQKEHKPPRIVKPRAATGTERAMVGIELANKFREQEEREDAPC